MLPASQDAILPGQLYKQLHSEWQNALVDLQPHIDSIERSLDIKNVAPEFHNIFRALNDPISSVSVVIFGQDPYPTAGVAHGLAFSAIEPNGRIPASLKNIFTELSDDTGNALRSQTDLSDWAHQGVLLLNRILTTSVGSSLSHSKLDWERVTDRVAQVLGERDVVAICWGRYAQDVTKFFREEWLITSPHPSPLSAYRGFFGSKPFSKANGILKKNGITPINW
jgi:uracil-DNA glycosylase